MRTNTDQNAMIYIGVGRRFTKCLLTNTAVLEIIVSNVLNKCRARLPYLYRGIYLSKMPRQHRIKGIDDLKYLNTYIIFFLDKLINPVM